MKKNKIIPETLNIDPECLPNLLTETEVAKLIKKSVHYLRRDRCKIGSNKIPYKKLGSSVRYDSKDILIWINSNPERLSNATSESDENEINIVNELYILKSQIETINSQIDDLHGALNQFETCIRRLNFKVGIGRD